MRICYHTAALKCRRLIGRNPSMGCRGNALRRMRLCVSRSPSCQTWFWKITQSSAINCSRWGLMASCSSAASTFMSSSIFRVRTKRSCNVRLKRNDLWVWTAQFNVFANANCIKRVCRALSTSWDPMENYDSCLTRRFDEPLTLRWKDLKPHNWIMTMICID